MELVEVEILVMTITSQYGVLQAGSILRTSPEFAAHLVNEAGAAKFIQRGAQKQVSDGAAGAGGKPSDGLTVEKLKDALTAKGVAIRDGLKKQELAELLDATARA